MTQRQDLRRHYIKEMFAGRLEQLKRSGIWLNGFKGEGEHKEWYTNGQLFIHNHFKNGKLDGEFESRWKNGQLYVRCYYKNDKLDGEYKEWRQSGRPLSHRYYKDGKMVKRIK